MKKRKLKGFVLPTVYVMTMAALFIGISFFASSLFKKDENYLFSVNPVTDSSLLFPLKPIICPWVTKSPCFTITSFNE